MGSTGETAARSHELAPSHGCASGRHPSRGELVVWRSLDTGQSAHGSGTVSRYVTDTSRLASAMPSQPQASFVSASAVRAGLPSGYRALQEKLSIRGGLPPIGLVSYASLSHSGWTRPSRLGRPSGRLSVSFALGLFQRRFFDQQPLALIAAPGRAEPDHDRRQLAQLPCAPGQLRVPGTQEHQVVQTGAAHAPWFVVLHDQKIVQERARAS
jgi:hypothetical protein